MTNLSDDEFLFTSESVTEGLRPDGKTQVTVRYENGRPIEILMNRCVSAARVAA
jgi:S-adenosylmethionine synthetase